MSLEILQPWENRHGWSPYRTMCERFSSYIPGVIRLEGILVTSMGETVGGECIQKGHTASHWGQSHCKSSGS